MAHPSELIIVRAGDALPVVAERRRQYPDLIRAMVGDAWRGIYKTHDPRVTEEPPSLARAAGIIVTGSSSSVTEQAPWMKRAGAFLRRAAEEGVPVFGICFGHQLLADAFGGVVQKNPRGREIGTVKVRLEDAAQREATFKEFPPEFLAQATHVDSVVTLPPGAVRLAQTDLEPNAAYKIGDTVRCVQFHPEIDADIIREYIRARAHLIDGEGLSSAQILESVQDAPFAARVLRSFVAKYVRA